MLFGSRPGRRRTNIGRRTGRSSDNLGQPDGRLNNIKGMILSIHTGIVVKPSRRFVAFFDLSGVRCVVDGARV